MLYINMPFDRKNAKTDIGEKGIVKDRRIAGKSLITGLENGDYHKKIQLFMS